MPSNARGEIKNSNLAVPLSPIPSVLTHSFSTRRDVFFQRPPAACILLQDGIGFGGPFEGLRVGVTLDEPGLNGSLEFGHALEDAAADLLAGDFGKQPLNQVDPG